MGEFGFNFESPSIEFELSIYDNYFSGYIYNERTTDSIYIAGKSWNIARTKQQDARLWGGEAKMQLHPVWLNNLSYTGSFSVCNGVLSDARNIPMMPPYRMNHEILFFGKPMRHFNNSFLRLQSIYVFEQKKVYSEEQSTPGYLICNASLGGETQYGHQLFSISIGVNNLLNKKYLDHLSRLRIYNVTGIGFNAFVSIVWKFSQQLKK
jgi:iron complex outermembrane receptor protein